MRSVKLNGWWRLWVVTTVILFLGLGGWYCYTVPTRESRIADISYEFLMVQNPKRIEDRCQDNLKCLEDWHYKDVMDKYSAAKSARLAKHIADVDETIVEDQVKWAVWFLEVWLGVSFTLLVLGGTIAWVRKGFKRA